MIVFLYLKGKKVLDKGDPKCRTQIKYLTGHLCVNVNNIMLFSPTPEMDASFPSNMAPLSHSIFFMKIRSYFGKVHCPCFG